MPRGTRGAGSEMAPRPDPQPSLTGGILAGGAGLRFGGQDKAWLRLRGHGLVEWTLAALRPQVGEILVSANRNLERYTALDVKVFEDAVDAPSPGAHQGPFAGIVRLLAETRSEWLLCVPCDAVILPADLGARLFSSAAAERADIAVLADAQGDHPTFCLIRTGLAEDARLAFEAGERAPRRWFARHRLARCPGDAPVNLNTPESLAALELRGELPPQP